MPSSRPTPAWWRSGAVGTSIRWTWPPARRRASRAMAPTHCAMACPIGSTLRNCTWVPASGGRPIPNRSATCNSIPAAEPFFPHADMLGTRAFSEPERYPQAGENNPDVHLGVIAATGGATRWLEVGDTRNAYLIARAGWMPNARAVYILRMNRVQNKIEMVSIDAESGEATRVFQESDPHWINLDGDIEFLKDGKRFLWTSQRDGGFRHIFLYSNDGKSVKQLTKGNWEVTAINAVDEAEAGGRIYY